jgi:hypothetical protein
MDGNWAFDNDFRALLSRLNRRQLIKGAGTIAGAAALSSAMPATSRADNETLNLLCWPGHADAAVVKPFEDKYHVKVVAKEYVGGEAMLALMNQSPPLNPADYPFADFWPEFQKFEGHWLDGKLFSVITRFGYLGLGYRTDMLSADDVKSYKILWDNKVKGKVGFFDWYLPSMGCLSLYNGNRPPYDISDAAFGKLKQSLFSLKPQSAGFYPMEAVFFQSDERHRGSDTRCRRLDHAVAVQEWSSRRGDGAVRGRHPMDGIALRLCFIAEEGSRQGVHPIYGFAGRPGPHCATARLLGIDSQQGRVGPAQRRVSCRCQNTAAHIHGTQRDG